MLSIRFYNERQPTGLIENKIDRIIYCCAAMSRYLPLDNDPKFGFKMAEDKLIMSYDSYFEFDYILDPVICCPFCKTPVELEKLQLVKGE